MKRWKICCGSLVLMAGLAPTAYGQLPGVGAGAAAAPGVGGAAAAPAGVGGVAGAPAGAPAAAPNNIWSMICMTPEQKQACKDKICNCALGKMLNNMLAPASAMTGGLVPQLCPAISPADLAKPADSAAGADARIKQDDADAKERRAAVRDLGHRDCHYWPEAQIALINALRADRNECVRMEAAWAFGNGCCCNKPVIEALVICVSGSEKDGNPSETSPRVRAGAEAALAHCLACYTEVVPVEPTLLKPKEGPKEGPREGPQDKTGGKTPDKLPNVGGLSSFQGVEYYKHLETVSLQQVVTEGRRVLDKGLTTSVPVQTSPSGSSHSVADIVANAFVGSPSTPTPTPAQTAPPPVLVDKPVPATPVMPLVVPPTQPAAVMPATTFGPNSAYQPASAKPAADSPKKSVSYQTPTFIPNTAPAEKTPVATVVLKTEPTPKVAFATAQPNLAQSGTTPAQVIKILQAGGGAQQRIWAAQTLSLCDGWTNPEVMEALVRAARSDSDANVRAACVRSIGRMNVCTLPVVTAMQEMKGDRDPLVRTEVEMALRHLGEVGSLQTR